MDYQDILKRNRRWVAETVEGDPEYFTRLVNVHRPQVLWIGCSDARVPANVITQTEPGEMFVHRNVANLVVPTDVNLLAVLQYAVEALGVRDVIVCGHHNCGGVKAAAQPAGAAPPIVDQWLANIRNVERLHGAELEAIADPDERHRRLVELNVEEQVYNLSRTSVVRDAWARGAELRLHGLVYRLEDGLLRDIGVTLDRPAGEAAAVGAAAASGRTSRPAARPTPSPRPGSERAVPVAAASSSPRPSRG